ncbi:MAG TPA: response regulator, partial [Pyrinomonadaceae bacterium]|nr:response regulator [Pyrinomonadaceae bacterium]
MKKHQIRVLLVEDDEDDYLLTRELLSDILTFECEIEWAATYAEAKEAVAEKAFDVCLIDYRLGERTGLELVREAIASGFRAPMILLTGQDDHAVDLEAMNSGAVDYLVKGKMGAAQLERSIRYALGRRSSEDALAEAAKRERAMIENALDVICTVNAEGRFVTVNPASFKIWGYQPKELIGTLYIDLVTPEDVPKTNEIAAKILSGVDATNFENRYIHKNGTLINTMWTAYWS